MISSFLTALLISKTAFAVPTARQSGVQGLDVSSYQPSIDWSTVTADGGQFVFIKATESTTFTSSTFSDQYTGATNAGLIRGAYHFARPADSDGADQANFFLQNGGGWSGDGITLPGALDLENNPSGDQCYDLSQADLVQWVSDFVSTYSAATGVNPVLYTTANFWNTCVGSDQFGALPLWIARYSSAVGALPTGWSTYYFWQYADSGTFPGDQDVFNGPDLSSFATNGS